MEYLQYQFCSRCSIYQSLVLNLVINGIPSILEMLKRIYRDIDCFKPCYKWNTFNTAPELYLQYENPGVLNLVINGIPSILGDKYAQRKKPVLF